MVFPPPNPPVDDLKDLVDDLLDAGYTAATATVLRAILRDSATGLMATRIREFEAEAARLEADGQLLTTDNAVYRALLADLDTTLHGQASRVDGVAGAVQDSGVEAGLTLARQLTLPVLSDSELAAIGIRWNRPSANAVNAATGYVTSDGWRQELTAFPTAIVDHINLAAIRGVIAGQNPVRTAREISGFVVDMPLSRANNLLRTLQLTSYRDAQSLSYQANSDILTGHIRIAVLDSRTCMACVSLHGTELGLNERVDDHHSGRCTSIGVVRGQSYNIQTGVEWFEGRSEDEQREQMGHAAYAAWRAGAVQLTDFVQPYTDPVFGQMIREASLKSLLGDAAADFYGL